ncbi:MAG: cytidine deaminase [Caldilineales bacterium]|nr:cytidine deaminase [Caldilineales bacterium]
MIDVAALAAAAQAARSRAYTPYSRYQVGAAVLCEDGEVFTGCNIENAVYPLTCCAERVAMFNAISSGRRSFRALAVATSNGGSPCGSCRQVMHEFGPEMPVFILDEFGLVRMTSVAELLPDSFGAAQLPAQEDER